MLPDAHPGHSGHDAAGAALRRRRRGRAGLPGGSHPPGRVGGHPRGRILLDPGIGFGKTFEHNLFLLRRLPELRVLGLPLLVGTSRKGFLGRLAGGKPASERLAATLGSVAAMAALGGRRGPRP
nr:dihydropteroate synthase [Myxococcus sp. MxC21-1]